MSRVVIIVPLREGGRDSARALLGSESPFDFEGAGLEVSLTEHEAVFVFEADEADVVEHPSEDVSFAATPGPGDSEGGDVFPPSRRG